MKKRIISVLLFLVVVMCLTACGKTPADYVVYDEVTTIAREVKDNPDYQLPEEYTARYEDENNRIAIITKIVGIQGYYEAKYDMTQETPKLLEFEYKYNVVFIGAVILFAIMVICFICFLAACIYLMVNG